MDKLKDSNDCKAIKKQKIVFIVVLLCFIIWCAINVFSLISDIISLQIGSNLLNIQYNIGRVLYALIFIYLAQSLGVLKLRGEQIIVYSIFTIMVVSSVFSSVFFCNFNTGVDNDLSNFQMYSSLILFVSIVQNLLVLTLGVLFIIQKNKYVKGLKILGVLCFLKVLLCCVAYVYQIVGLKMNMYYGLFGDYRFVIFIAGIIQFFAYFVLGFGILYFLFINGKTNHSPCV